MAPTASIIGSSSRRYVSIRDDGTKLRKLATIPGVHKHREGYNMPLDPYLVLYAQRLCSELELSMGLAQWLARQQAQTTERRLLAEAEDCTLTRFARADDLFPFQRVGVQYLLKFPRSILGDQAGLGKTVQCIGAVAESGRDKRVLVLCNNSHKWWWKSEIRAWLGPDTPVTVVEAAHRRFDFQYWRDVGGWIIVNWELLHRMPELAEVHWQWVFADEAHKIRNRKTLRFKAFKRLRAHYIVPVTASIFGNHPAESWALLNACNPTLFSSYWRYWEMFVDYEGSLDGPKVIVGARNADLHAYVLSGYMLRRYKADVGIQLPPKTHTRIPLELTKRQQEMYYDLAYNLVTELSTGDELEVTNAIALITRFRQIASTTATLEPTDHSCKLDAVMDLLEEREGSKVVVFTQFRKTAEALIARLELQHIRGELLMGGIKAGPVVQAFQEDDEVRVLVATTGAGGESHTFTAADTAVFVEEHWNPEHQAQSEDRVHRIGQTRPVQIITLYCPDTVDDLVREILELKLQMNAAVILHRILRSLEVFLNEYGGEY